MTPTDDGFNADYLAKKPERIRKKLIEGMSEAQLKAFASAYEIWARASQREPTVPYHIWLLLGGRGAGKTFVGASVTNRRAKSGQHAHIVIGAATPEDARDICVEGPSGILKTAFPGFVPEYIPSKRRVVWPNGCIGHIRSGAEPERFRGINSSFAWLDELAAYQYPTESLDNALLGLRIGKNPQMVITTTPKPIPVIRSLIKESQQRDSRTIITTDSSYANRANLSEDWWHDVVRKYEGTTLGRQEIFAELLDDVPGAMWRQVLIETNRVGRDHPALSSLGRTVVAVDPAVTSSANSNETGIISVAVGTGQWKEHAFVLRDDSGRLAASRWPEKVAAVFKLPLSG